MKARTAIGTHRHLVTVQGAGTPVADGDGGFTTPWVNLAPATWYCSIEPATARDLERVAAGTVISTATHIVSGRYHPGITVSTRIVDDEGTVYEVTGVSDPERRHVMTICTAVQLIGAVPVVDDSWIQTGWTQ